MSYNRGGILERYCFSAMASTTIAHWGRSTSHSVMIISSSMCMNVASVVFVKFPSIVARLIGYILCEYDSNSQRSTSLLLASFLRKSLYLFLSLCLQISIPNPNVFKLVLFIDLKLPDFRLVTCSCTKLIKL